MDVVWLPIFHASIFMRIIYAPILTCIFYVERKLFDFINFIACHVIICFFLSHSLSLHAWIDTARVEIKPQLASNIHQIIIVLLISFRVFALRGQKRVFTLISHLEMRQK